MIEFDIESTGLQPWSGKQVAFSMQFWDGDDPRGRSGAEFLWVATAGAAVARPEDIERVRYWLERGAKEGIRAHNFKFDRAFGEATLPEHPWPGDGCWHDSMIAAQVINERRSNALKALGDSLLGEGSSDLQKGVKAWLTAERARRKKAAVEAGTELVEPDYSDVPAELIVPYGLEDVFLQRGISDQFDLVLKQQSKLAAVVEFERKVGDALYAVEKRGLPCDREGYHKLRLEVMENLERLEDDPKRIALTGNPEVYAEETGGKRLEDFNSRSSANVIAALKACGADMQYMVTEDGKVKSADKDNLGACDHPLARAILEFRGEYKVLTTYVSPMVHRHYDSGLRAWKEPFVSGRDGRIHANYRQVGARTGRMSVSDPPVQQMPRDDLRLRYNIKADAGHKLVACDLSNIEMRIFAAYAGAGRLLDAVQRRADLHELTAKLIGITERVRPGGHIESARQRGKTYNFSVIYGGGLRTIKRQLRVTQAEARLLKQRYYDAYPEVQALQNRISYRLRDQGYIEDMWGRRYRCTDPDREDYKFTNYLVQGSAAQILKDALVSLHADGVPVVALIHDEIIAHVPEADAEEALQLITHHLTAAARPGGKLWLNDKAIVPLDADGCIVDRWSQAKDPEFVPRWAQKAGTLL